MTISKDHLPQWDYTELTLDAEYDGNPFKEVRLSGRFSNGEQDMVVRGFYDGDGLWKIRFMPPLEGSWTVVTESNLEALNGQEASLKCVAAEDGVHGPVRVAQETHFAYADGTAYYPVGTTCYVWNHQGEELEAKTLETLAKSPFNKIRFCVYPKRYTFNHNEPLSYPFPGKVETPWNREDQDDYSPKPRDFWDFETFNPEYFQHLDDCVLKLRGLSIEADLILFHPYDFGAWGFDCIPEAANNRILEYLVARLGAFRNIWWSFANEYDFFQNKALQEWQRYIDLVTRIDPYNHLRSIHNGRTFYNHNNPGITHCSIQSKDMDSIPKWLKTYKKPVVIDECGYEGNIDRDWGNISGWEMTHRFWKGFAAGAYVGHGETYLHPRDVLWWSKGGELHGESPQRIAFLRDIIESFSTEDSKNLRSGDSFLPKPGRAMAYGRYPDFALYYFGINRPSFRDFVFPEDGQWTVEVIDTWEMTITLLDQRFNGPSRIPLPGKEGIAIRIRKVADAK